METEPASKVTIRPTRLDDTEPLRRMHAKSWLEAYPNEAAGVPLEWVIEVTNSWLTKEGLAKSREYFKGIFGNDAHFHRVAVSAAGEIVGLIHGSKIEGKQLLDALYIDPAMYGTGLAQKMIDELMEWFDLSNNVELEVASYNERAKAFYRKYGFEEVGGVHDELFKGKMPIMTMMRKGDKQ